MTTVVGDGTAGWLDGVGASNSRLKQPRGIALDHDGTHLYVADSLNHVIRRIVLSTNEISTIAGDGNRGSRDGQGSFARFAYPHGLVMSEYLITSGSTMTSSYLYVSELHHRIRGVNLTDSNNVMLLAGFRGQSSGYVNGNSSQARFNRPVALALSPAEYYGAMDAKLYIADRDNNAIRVMYEDGSHTSWYTWPGASVGDDPTFVGADRLPYEVRGEPWRYFNLISAPRLSLNAQFLPVPEGYVHGTITDTVLGTLHLAVCEPDNGRVTGMLFDVFSGEVRCTRSPPQDADGHTLPTPCVEATTAAGVTMSEEVAVCFLSSMRCAYTYPTELAALQVIDRARLPVPRTRPPLAIPSARPLRIHRPSSPLARSLHSIDGTPAHGPAQRERRRRRHPFGDERRDRSARFRIARGLKRHGAIEWR